MLAINSFRSSANQVLIAVALTLPMLLASGLSAQTTPAQRYQPVRQSAYEVPERMPPMDGARRIPPIVDGREMIQSPAPSIPASPHTAPAPSIAEASAETARPEYDGNVLQTSYQEPVSREPIRLSSNSAERFNPSQTAPAESHRASDELMARKQPQDFANAMGRRRATLGSTSSAFDRPVVDSEPIAEQMERMRQIEAQRQAQAEMNNTQLANVSVGSSTIPVGVAPRNQTGQSVDPISELREAATQAAAIRIDAENRAAANASDTTTTLDASETSAPEFMASINQTAANTTSDVSTREFQQAASDQQPMATVASLPSDRSDGDQSIAMQDNLVQPVSATSDGLPEQMSMKLSAPAIDVVSIGPKTIGINKPSKYQVIVRNNSSIAAEQILVGINLPSWIEIEEITLTSGGKELTDGIGKARLIWKVDQVAGNSTQTITFTAIPRKSDVFDVGVEWTLVPRTGKTAIRVTEPKLEMVISGPKEVMYGEIALYHVAVRNPGTGTAENVHVMLPEALGGQRAPLYDIAPGKEKNFQVELLARTAGDMNLVATVTADGNLTTSADRALKVRRANMEINITGPPLKYAGGIGQYTVKITNSGDATATELVTAVALPPGVKYLSGIDAVKLIDGGMRWPVGSIDSGQTKTYTMECQLDTSGELKLEVGTRGKGDLAASGACMTMVETVADLVLSVADPKGPLPIGDKVPYTIKIRNRGTKAAKGVNLVMQFSEGIEPKSASGIEHQIVPGQVLFSPITQIDPGQEISFEVTAEALKSGTHVFRAQLTCDDSDAREIAEGTTRFFGDATISPAASTANGNSNSFDGGGLRK